MSKSSNSPIYDAVKADLGFDPESVSPPWTVEGCKQRAAATALAKAARRASVKPLKPPRGKVRT